MHRKRQEGGQVLTEYTIATLALIVALFVPWNGQPSAVANFMDKARTYHKQASYPLSLP